MFINFAITSFVNEFFNILSWRISKLLSKIPISNEWFNSSQHINCCLINSHKCTIMNLSKSEKSENSYNLWAHLINTSYSNNKCNSWSSWNIDLSCKFSRSTSTNLWLLWFLILSFILLSTFKNICTFSFIWSSTSLSLLF